MIAWILLKNFFSSERKPRTESKNGAFFGMLRPKTPFVASTDPVVRFGMPYTEMLSGPSYRMIQLKMYALRNQYLLVNLQIYE